METIQLTTGPDWRKAVRDLEDLHNGLLSGSSDKSILQLQLRQIQADIINSFPAYIEDQESMPGLPGFEELIARSQSETPEQGWTTWTSGGREKPQPQQSRLRPNRKQILAQIYQQIDYAPLPDQPDYLYGEILERDGNGNPLKWRGGPCPHCGGSTTRSSREVVCDSFRTAISSAVTYWWGTSIDVALIAGAWEATNSIAPEFVGYGSGPLLAVENLLAQFPESEEVAA